MILAITQNKRGFYGTLALTGVGTGLVPSALTILIIEKFATKDQIYSFAWRIPFFISVLGSILAFYMRLNLLEPNDFEQEKKANNLLKNPFMEMIKNHKKTLLILFGIFLSTPVSFFIVFIFGKALMIDFLYYTPQLAGEFNLYTVVSYTIATLIFGYLADKINVRYIILLGILLMIAVAIPFIRLLCSGSYYEILFVCLLMGCIIGMTEGTLNPLVVSSFPVNIRATCVAFCWNFTSVAFGGIAPMIAMWLHEEHGGAMSIAYFLIAVCFASLVSVLMTFTMNVGIASRSVTS